MNKKIKVIELLNLLAENKIKRGTRIKYGNYTFKIDYPNLCGIYIEGGSTGREDSLFSQLDICALNYEVEILEDEEEIDINDIEELVGNVNVRMNNKTVDADDLFYTISNIVKSVGSLKDKTNQLVKAVKQLDKKINKED